jgi:branched-chain amino acid transport system ATP-binding protein
LAPDALSLRNVHTFYGDSHVLHGVSFSLQPGDVLALLGRNGAGKTTCISTIIGFLNPKQGDIRLFGEPIAGLSPERISQLGIGLVPQGRRVFPSLSVRENLMVARQRESRSHNPWGLDRIYDMFPRLGERHGQFAGTLSGGEQQMLAIGRALLASPKVLLLDEPSMGLAPILVAQIFSIITEINQQGMTILLVEQNAAQALRRAHRAYVLETGRVVKAAPAAELLADESVRNAYLGGNTQD